MYNINWLPLYEIKDINEGVEYFNLTLKSVINVHAPFKQIKCHSEQAKWVTGEFLSLVDSKHHYCNIYRRRPTAYNATKRREAIARVKYMKKVLKRDYVRDALQDCDGDSKRTWRLIKTLWPTKSRSTSILKINDLTDPQSIANALNNHFCEIGPKLSRNIQSLDPLSDSNESGNIFELRPIEMDEIIRVLSELSPSKACGLDGLTARLLKS